MQDTLHKKFVASANKSSVGTFHQNHNKRRNKKAINLKKDYSFNFKKAFDIKSGLFLIIENLFLSTKTKLTSAIVITFLLSLMNFE